MLGLLWRLTRGYRLRPWCSPYLRWRMETYGGLHAAEITFAGFWKFAWKQRRDLLRYLRWAEGMRIRAGKQRSPASPRGEG
ncbi:MAG: hypothetical protein LAP40_08430 [Acidobacteriia bacterium]|nr:hypothetical protein [Terriglobia bacterium]